MNVQPLRSLVWIKPLPLAAVSQGGVHLMHHHRKPTMRGTVAAVGPEVRSSLKVGDKVMFPPNSGSDVTVDGVKYTAMLEESLICKLED